MIRQDIQPNAYPGNKRYRQVGYVTTDTEASFSGTLFSCLGCLQTARWWNIFLLIYPPMYPAKSNDLGRSTPYPMSTNGCTLEILHLFHPMDPSQAYCHSSWHSSVAPWPRSPRYAMYLLTIETTGVCTI